MIYISWLAPRGRKGFLTVVLCRMSPSVDSRNCRELVLFNPVRPPQSLVYPYDRETLRMLAARASGREREDGDETMEGLLGEDDALLAWYEGAMVQGTPHMAGNVSHSEFFLSEDSDNEHKQRDDEESASDAMDML